MIAKRIRRWAAVFIIGCASMGGLVAIAATPAQATGCGPGNIGITYGTTGTGLVMTVRNLPDGPSSFIIGSVNFTVQCPPLNGSITLELEKKFRTGTSTYWAQQGDSATRSVAPPLPKGFSLTVGPWLCAGRSTWRMLLTWKGTAGDGTYSEGSTYLPSSSGQIFSCLS